MITLITGASRGLGFAIGEALAATSHVIAVARTVGGLEDLDDAIKTKGGEATLVPLDLTDADGVSRMCLSIHERWGGLDLWVHTATQPVPLAPLPHTEAAEFTKSMTLHANVARDLIVKIDPLLRAKSGRAVYMQDNHQGEKFFGTYAAAKAAEAALFAAWASENEKLGPIVSAFHPAPMPTATRARFFPGEDKAALSTPRDEANRVLTELGLAKAY
ncbi:MAG: SDR family NAD(P)-dependent oxidoreductase [Pseudomonadota bacterium]